MSANIKTLSHYRELEGSAKEAANSRDTIDQLRQELHRVIFDLSHLASKIHTEVEQYDLLISRAKATLLRTLPGGELDELDAMPKPQRKSELFDVIANICLPPVHRANCDCCNERPWTHRRDAFGIETYVCDECVESP